MHTDDEGVVHPLVLAADTESADVHFTSCSTCGSRWAGPFKTEAMATKVADLANASAYYELPARIRPSGAGLCHGPDGLPIGTPGAVLAEDAVPQHVQLGQVAGDVGKGILLGAFVAYTVVRAVVLFVVGAVRFMIRLGRVGVVLLGAFAVAGYLGLRAADPYVPDATTLAPVLLPAVAALAGIGLVVVLARGLRSALADPAEAETLPVENITRENIARTDYSTPLTTAGGASNVVPVSKTPADESPKG